jgi:hypothetical protein
VLQNRALGQAAGVVQRARLWELARTMAKLVARDGSGVSWHPPDLEGEKPW